MRDEDYAADRRRDAEQAGFLIRRCDELASEITKLRIQLLALVEAVQTFGFGGAGPSRPILNDLNWRIRKDLPTDDEGEGEEPL